ncbi:MAG: hypothetical protein QM667_12850 [Asticcacaulis sp.]
MDQTPETQPEHTPQARRAHLRAVADRMLSLLVRQDDPEDGDGIEKTVRRALLIERLYARCDTAEAGELRRMMQAIDDRVEMDSKTRWGERALERPFVLPNGETIRPPVTPFVSPCADAPIEEQGAEVATRHVPPHHPVPPELLLEVANTGPEEVDEDDWDHIDALRARVEAAGEDDHPQGLVWHGRDFGLIGSEAFQVLCGADVFTRLQLRGYSQTDVVATLRALSAHDIRLIWPDIFENEAVEEGRADDTS